MAIWHKDTQEFPEAISLWTSLGMGGVAHQEKAAVAKFMALQISPMYGNGEKTGKSTVVHVEKMCSFTISFYLYLQVAQVRRFPIKSQSREQTGHSLTGITLIEYLLFSFLNFLALLGESVSNSMIEKLQ